MILPRTNLYLIKSEDPVLVLELLSDRSQGKKYEEFWEKAEEFVLKILKELNFS